MERSVRGYAALLVSVGTLAGCGLPWSRQNVVITPDEARVAFTSTVDAIVKAGADLDIPAQDRYESGPLRRLDDATLSGLRAMGKTSSTASPPPSTPIVFVPRQSTYPAYFVAAQRYQSSAYRERLHLFERRDAGANWTDIALTDFFKGASEPSVQLDSDGYASVVDLHASGLALRPDEQPALLSNALANLARGDADLTLNEATVEILKAGFATTRQGLLNGGIQVSINYQPGPALLALRLSDGGALVFYSLDSTQLYRPAPGYTKLVQQPDRGQWGNLLAAGSYTAVTEVSVVMVAGIVPPKQIGNKPGVMATHEGIVSSVAF